MDTELKSQEPALKEVLYRALEELQTTKGALYLLEGDRYRLITSYGFRPSQIPAGWGTNDLPADVLTTQRAPFYVNGLTGDTRFSELLYGADTTRMLLAPLYSRGHLVGFLDLRDKARQAPFSEVDLRTVSGIVDGFLTLFAKNRMYGQNEEQQSSSREPEITRLHEPKPAASGIIEAAQAAISRGLLRSRDRTAGPSDEEVRTAALVLPSIVSIPGAVVAALTPVSRLAVVSVVAARGAISEEALQYLDSRINGWMRKRGEAEPVAASRELLQPFGAVGVPLESSRIQTVLSAPVRLGPDSQLVLTVGFDHHPDASAKAALERFLPQVEKLASLASASQDAARLLDRAARHLLEPDLKRYPELVAHSRRVAELAERLAIASGLPARQVEEVRLAGLVHDVGMRVLDYERLYRKEHPSSEEIRYMRSHPVVGAALIADSPLGAEIASMVLHHHERPDGTGYPDRLTGDAIPIGSRIIAICEAYDAMTAEDSYQTAVPPAAAVGKIRRSAGEQFDADLALRFAQMMNVGPS